MIWSRSWRTPFPLPSPVCTNVFAPRFRATSRVASLDFPSTTQTRTWNPDWTSLSCGIRSITFPTPFSSLRAGSTTSMLPFDSQRGPERKCGSKSLSDGGEFSKLTSRLGLARPAFPAPGPAGGCCAGDRSVGGSPPRPGVPGSSGYHGSIQGIVWAGRLKRGMFHQERDPSVCLPTRHIGCKRTSKNTKGLDLQELGDSKMPGRGSVTRSVRIEKDADERLRLRADQGDTSVNTLVNRALRKFVEWDAYGEKFGFITLPAVILVKLMDCLTDEEAAALGEWAGKNLLKEYITFWFTEVTPETLLEGFPKLLSKYGRAFTYEELVEDDRRVIILKHGGGPRWSTFYEETIRTAFHDLLQREVRVEKSDNQVVIRFRMFGTGRKG